MNPIGNHPSHASVLWRCLVSVIVIGPSVMLGLIAAWFGSLFTATVVPIIWALWAFSVAVWTDRRDWPIWVGLVVGLVLVSMWSVRFFLETRGGAGSVSHIAYEAMMRASLSAVYFGSAWLGCVW